MRLARLPELGHLEDERMRRKTRLEPRRRVLGEGGGFAKHGLEVEVVDHADQLELALDHLERHLADERHLVEN